MEKKSSFLGIQVFLVILVLNFFFNFSGEILSGILSLKLLEQEISFLEGVLSAFRPLVLILWVILSSLIAWAVMRFLQPLLGDWSGDNLRKARLASIKLPMALILIQNIGWAFGVMVYFLARRTWESESGHYFWWIMNLKISAGLVAGVFSNIVINNLILPLKLKLNMHHIRDKEKDFFLRFREPINIVVIIYLLGTYLSFIAYAFMNYSYPTLDFDPFLVLLLTLGVLATLIFIMVALSSVGVRTQVKNLTKGLKALLNKNSREDQLIQLINFDDWGDIITLFNKVLVKSKKEGKVLLEVREELLDDLKEMEESARVMEEISNLQQDNTSKLTEEKQQLEENMRALEDILLRQNQSLNQALDYVHQIARSNQGMMEEDEELKKSTEASRIQAESQISQSQERMEKTKELITRVQSITGQVNEAKDKSFKVHHILTEIKEVAEKTHVLAINASIESAHSGAFGKGFAVIAGEVRKVAEGTADAVRQTAGILEEMRVAVDQAAHFAQQAHSMVSETRQDTEAVQGVLSQLSQSFNKNAQGIMGIAKLVSEQNTLVKDMVSTMDGLGEMAQASEVAVKNQSSGKERLDEVVDLLRQSTGQGVEQNARLAQVTASLSKLGQRLQEMGEEEKETP